MEATKRQIPLAFSSQPSLLFSTCANVNITHACHSWGSSQILFYLVGGGGECLQGLVVLEMRKMKVQVKDKWTWKR